MKFLELVKARYSVRKFSSREVEQGKLDRILEAGQYAPTAKNNQPQFIYVLRGESLEKASPASPCLYGAPVVLIVCYDKEQAAVLPEMNQVPFGYQDTSIVITHMMLQATALGLGTCWVGCFYEEELHRIFDIPDNLVIAGLLDIGYPAEGCTPADRHELRKDIEETVKYL